MTWILSTIILLFTFAFGLFFGVYFSRVKTEPLSEEKPMGETRVRKIIRELDEKFSGKRAAYSPTKDIEKQIFKQEDTYSYFDSSDSVD